MPPLTILESRRMVRIARAGRLLPWLGPAMRGLLGGRLRSRVCVYPVAEQITTRQHCSGCPKMKGCAYGETYEPDPPADVHIAAGWDNTVRPVVISPEFPIQEFGTPGIIFEVRITLLGTVARAYLDSLWEALRIGGADLAIGLGDDHVLFDAFPGPIPDVETTVELPLDAIDETRIPSVRIELRSPLFLNETGANGKKQVVLRPSFSQLMRAGLRMLGPMHKFYAEPLPEEVFAKVKTASESVSMIRAGFEEFRQRKWSHRTKEHFEMRGVIGWAEYGPIPSWLLPWLTWAGRLHVGTHRIAGGGSWTISRL